HPSPVPPRCDAHRKNPPPPPKPRSNAAEHGASCRLPHCSQTPTQPPSTCCAGAGSSPVTISVGSLPILRRRSDARPAMVTKVLGEALQLVPREEVERQLDEWLDQDACPHVAT